MLDLGTGSARDESLTRCLVATQFARRLGPAVEEVAAVLYTSLLEHLGCTAYASGLAAIFGDEVAATGAFRTDWERPADLLGRSCPTWPPRPDGPPAGAGHDVHHRPDDQRRGPAGHL